MDNDTLDALDAFLMSERAPGDSMQLSDLDGFLTALAVRPRAESPPDLLKAVWGGEQPAYADEDEAKFVMNTILDWHDEIKQTLRTAPHELQPIFWDGPDGQPIVDDWAAGFLDAVSARADDWRPLFDDDDAFWAIAPIIIAAQDLETVREMGVDADMQVKTLRDLPHILTACLVKIRDFLAGPPGNDSAPPTKH